MSFAQNALHRRGDASSAQAPHRNQSWGARIFAATITCCLIASASDSALAQTGQTWVGGVDGNWSTAGNWSTTNVPTQGPLTTLTFGASTGTTILNQDLGNPFVLNALYLNRTTTAMQQTINGSPLLFAGTTATLQLQNAATGVGASAATYTVGTDIIIGGVGLSLISTSNNTNVLRLTGTTITTTGNSVTLTLGGSSTGANTIINSIQNDISLQKIGAGVWNLSGNNTFTGNVSVQAGTLRITNTNALGLGTNLYLGSTGGVGVLSMSTANALTLTRDIFLSGVGTGTGTLSSDGIVTVSLSVNGTVQADGGTKVLILTGTNANGSINLNYLNSLVSNGTGTLSLNKTGNATWVLANMGNTFNGGVTISGGALRVALTNGVVQGIGTSGIRFGAAVGGNAVLETNGTLTLDLGTGANQIHWGTTLSSGGGFSAAGGQLNVLLNASGDTNLIWNTTANFTRSNSELQFGSLSADSMLVFQNPINLSGAVRTIRLQDNATTTNDMTMLTGGISSTGANGGLLLAGSGTLILSGSNSYLAGTTITGAVNVVLRDDLGLGTGALMITGGALNNDLNPITLSNSVTLSGNLIVAGSQTMTINGAIVTSGTAGRTITFSNTMGTVINNSITLSNSIGNALTFAGAATNTVYLNGNIVNGTLAGGVNYSGPTVMVSGSNSYSGGTTITAGRVYVSNLTNGFGTGTLQLNAGTLLPTSSGTLAYAVNLNGSMTLSGPSIDLTIDGPGLTQILAATTLSNGLNSLTFNDEVRTYATFVTTTGSGLVTLNNGLSLTGTTAAMTVLANSGIGMIVNNGINLSADGAIAHALTLRTTGTATLTANGPIVDGGFAGGSIVITSGTVTINGSNSYSGSTSLSVGMLAIGNDRALGTSRVVITSTLGLIRADGAPRTLANDFLLLGNFTISGVNSLTLGGNITVSGAARTISFGTAAAAPTYLTGTLFLGETGTDRALTFAQTTTNQLYLLGNIVNGTGAGGGSISYGVSEYILGGSNTYGGLTSVLSGTVTLATDTPFGTSTVMWTGGTLKADGTGTGSRGFGNNIGLLGNILITGSQAVTMTGTITATAARTITANDTGGTIIGNILLNPSPTTFAITLAGDSPLTVTGLISQGSTTNPTVSITNTGGVTFLGNNTFQGVTSLGAGSTLTFGNGTGTSGNLSGVLNAITLTSKVVFNYSSPTTFGLTSTANIIGAGGVDIQGAGVRFDKANAYTGPTTLNPGATVVVGINGALGTGNLTVLGGTLSPEGSRSLANTVSLLGDLNITGTQTLTLTGLVTNSGGDRALIASNLGGLTLSNVNLAESGTAARTMTIAGLGGVLINGTVTNGSVGSTGSLLITNTSLAGVVLAGNANFTGMTTIGAGARLQIGTGAAAGSLLGNVTLSDATSQLVFNRTGLYSQTGVISGLGGVSLIGTGTVVFTGANFYSGQTTLNAGVLQVANNQALGDSQLSVFGGALISDTALRTLTNAVHLLGTLSLTGATSNLSLGGVIDGTGGLLVTSGTVALGGNNSFSGSSTLTSGTLVLQSDRALGDATWVLSGGSLRIDSAPRTLSNNLTVSGSLTLTGDSALTLGGGVTLSGNFNLLNNITAAAVTLSGPIALGDATAARTLTLTGNAAATTIVNGNISDGPVTGGSLVFSTGSFVVNGNNTYTGLTSILSGTVTIGSSSPFGSNELRWTAGTIQSDGSARTLTNSLVTLLGNVAIAGSQQLTLSGTTTMVAARTVTLNNTAGVLLNNISLVPTPTAFVLTFNGPGALTVTGAITQASTTNAGVVFTNTGGVTLLSDNTYRGNTTVNPGVTLTLGSGVGSNGNLSGNLNLTTGGKVIFNYGALTTFGLTSTAVITGGATSQVEINGAAGGGVIFDKVNTYTGVTSITQGTLRMGIANAVNGASSMVVNSTGTWDLNGFNVSVFSLSDGPSGGGSIISNTGAAVLTVTQGFFSGAVTGTNLGFQKLGAGVLTLSNANQFIAQSTINGGRLILANDLALGTANITALAGIIQGGSSPLNLTNNISLAGTLEISGTSNVNIASPMVVALGTTRTLAISNSGITTINSIVSPVSNTVRLDLNVTMTNGGELIVGNINRNSSTFGVINMTGGVGTVRMIGAANELTHLRLGGDLTLILQGGNESLAVSGTVNFTMSNNAVLSLSGVNQTFTTMDSISPNNRITNSGSTLAILSTSAGTFAGSIDDGSGGIALNKVSSGVLTLGNDNTFTGPLTIAAGTLNIGTGGATGKVQAASILNNGTLVWNSTAGQTYTGDMTGIGAMTVTGGGTYVFTGAVTYTGATTIGNNTAASFGPSTVRTGATALNIMNNATLTLVGGANMGTGAATLANGARLSGAGTIGGLVTANFGSDIIIGGEGTVGTMTLGSLSLIGASLNFDLGTLGNGDLLNIITGSQPNITQSSFININALSGFTGGVYTIMNYSGNLTTTNLNQLVFNGPSGYSMNIISTTGSLSIDFIAALQKVWTGSSSNYWDVNFTSNFTLSGSGTPVVYNDGDAVIFDDSTLVTDITISNNGAAVVPTSVLVVNTAQTYTFRGDPIGGSNGLDKQGSGILVLANNNTFTGAVQVSGGTLQLGDGGASGSITPTLGIQLENNSTLLVNRSGTISLAGSITGSGNLVKMGSGVLNVSGTNTYLGNTTILGGTLQVLRGTLPANATSIITISGNTSELTLASSNALTATSVILTSQGQMNISGSAVTLNNLSLRSGTVNVNSTSLTSLNTVFGGDAGLMSVVNVAIGTTLALTGNINYDATNNPLGAVIKGPGTVSFGALRNITVSDSTALDADTPELTINAFMTAASAFSKQGAGMLYLTGNNAINVSTTLLAGTVMVGNDNALGTALIQLNGGALRGDGVTRTLANAMFVRGNSAITGNSELNFTGTFMNASAGVLTIDNTGLTRFNNLVLAETNSARVLTISGAGSAEFLQISQGAGTGTDSLVFNGTGTYDLYGASTLSNNIRVGNGLVRVFNRDVFGGVPAAVVSIGGGTSANPMLLTMGAMDLTQNINVVASTTSVLAFGNLSAVTSTFSGSVNLATSVNIVTTAGGTVVISGTINGAGGITKTGDGLLVLTGTNSFTGTSTILGGTLQLGSAAGLGNIGRLNVELSTTLDLNGLALTLTNLSSSTLGGGRVTTNVPGEAVLSVQAGVFGGVIQNGSGTIALNKVTSGTLVLFGDNTYTGLTTIAAGTLQLGNGGAFGTLQTAGITNSGVLAFNGTNSLTFGTQISGTGAVQITAGTVTFTGANLYSGVTTILAGATLNLGDGGAGGTISSTVFNAGLLTFNHNVTVTFDRPISGTGSVLVQGGAVAFTSAQAYTGMTTIASGANLILSGAAGNLTGSVTNNGLLTFNPNVTYGNVISGTGDVLVNSVTLTFTNGQTYTGVTTISSGANLVLTGTLSSLASSVQNFGQFTLNRGAATTLNYDSVINGTGNVSLLTGTLAFTSAQAYTGITTVAANATLVLTGTAGNVSGNIASNGAVNFDHTVTYGGNITGSGLVRVTNGIVTLSGVNTYTGGTQVNVGTLLVEGSLGNTTVTVASGATLGGGGTLSGPVNIAASGALNGNLTISAAVSSSGSINPGTFGTVGTLKLNSLILNGGSLNFDLGTIGLNNSDRILINTAVIPNVTATTALNFNALSGLGEGLYTLISGYTGTLTTTSFSRLLTGSLSGYSLTLQNNSNSLDVLVSLLSQYDLVWTGSASNTWDMTALNWNGNAATFFNGVSKVTFDNSSLVNSISVTDSGVSVLSMTVNNDTSHNYLFTGGDISGATINSALYKTGDGTLIFANNVSFSGGATVNGGTLQIGNGTGSGSFAGNIVNNGLVAFNRTGSLTYSDAISGTGAVSITGGTVIFTGANTYSDVTSILSGTLQIGNGGATGQISGNVFNAGNLVVNRTDAVSYGGVISGNGNVSILTGTVTLLANQTYTGATAIASGATLNLGIGGTSGLIVSDVANNGTLNFNVSGSTGFANSISGNGSVGILTGTVVYTAAQSYSGVTTIASGANLILSGTAGSVAGNVSNGGLLTLNHSLTYGGVISGNGAVRVQNGTATFIANQQYSGGTVIADGAVLNAGIGGTSGMITGDVANSGVLNFNVNAATTYIGTISGTGSVGVLSGTMTFTSAQLYTGVTTIASGANLVLGGPAGSVAGNVANAGLLTLAHTLTYGGSISGAGAVQVTTGTVTLAGASNYSGPTAVDGGSLLVNGSLGTSTVSVAGGAVLGGNGTLGGPVNIAAGGALTGGLAISGPVSVAGTLTPGTLGTVGTMTLASLVLNGATLNFDLGSHSLGGFDQLIITGGAAPTIGTTAFLSFNQLGGFSVGTYSLINGYSGTIANFGGMSFGALSGVSMTLQNNAGSLDLFVASVGANLTWTGGTGTWDYSTGNFSGGTTFTNGDNVSFLSTGSPSDVTITTGGVQPGTVLVNNDLASPYSFTGGSITGIGSLTKQGVGSLTFSNVNNYSGGTSLLGGQVNIGSGGSISNTGNVFVSNAVMNVVAGGSITGGGQTIVSNSGTLIANGTVFGTVTVQGGGKLQGSGEAANVVVLSGGHLSPGNSVGKLTLDGNPLPGSQGSLTLFGGSDLTFEFNHATTSTGGVPGTDWDYIDLTGGGMLHIMNANNQNTNNQITVHIDSWKLDNSGHGGGVIDGTNANGFNSAAATGWGTGQQQTYFWKFVGLDSAANVTVTDPYLGSLAGRFRVIDDATGAGVFGSGNPFSRPINQFGQGTFKILDGDFGQGYGLYVYYSAIPEPSSMILAGVGSLAAGWYGRRRKRKQASDAAAEAAQQPAPPSAADITS